MITHNIKGVLAQKAVGDVLVVTVCAWCLPGRTLFDQNPHLEGNIILSHGICPAHKADFIAGLNSLPTKATP